MMIKTKILTNILTLFVLAIQVLGYAQSATPQTSQNLLSSLSSSSSLISYPEKTEANCRDGTAKIYDECSDQVVLFQKALKRANHESKILLVSYGAEWCIWCHVFDAYIKGGKTKFDLTYAGTAITGFKVYRNSLRTRKPRCFTRGRRIS